MGNFKVRRRTLAQGGLQVGASGSPLSSILYGTVSASVPAISASGDIDSASINAPGISAGDVIFITPAQSNTGVIVYSACATADNVITASWCSATGVAVSASTLQLHYLAITS